MTSLSSLNEKKKLILEKGKQFQAEGNQEQVIKAKDLLRTLQEEEASLNQRYLDEAVSRKNSLYEGLASGETISDRTKTKIIVPDFDMNGFSNTTRPDVENERIDSKINPQKLKQQLAKLGYDNIDTEKGVSAIDTAFLAGLRSDASRQEYFQKKLGGNELIETLNINGKQNYIIKNKEGKTMLALPPGVNVKDVGAFIAGEAFPTMAGIASAPVGVAGGPAAPLTVSAAAAAGYSGAGAVQDTFLRSVLDMDIKPKEIVVDRAKEAALGTLIGYGASKALQPFAKRVGLTIENQFATELKASEEILKNSPRFSKVNELGELTPVGSEMAGEAGTNIQRGLAGKFKGMDVSTEMQQKRNALGEIQSVIMNEGKDLPPVDLSRVFKKAETLSRQVSKRNANIRAANDRILSERVDILRPTPVNKVELGNTLDNLLSTAKQNGDNINEATFNAFYSQPNVAQVSVPKAQVLSQLEKKLLDPRNRGLKSPEVSKLLKEYQRDFPDNLTLRDIDNIKKGISGATSKTGSSSVSQQVASGLAEEAGLIFDGTISKFGLVDDWARTMQTFDEASLAFRRTSPGAILKDKFGARVKSPEQMVDAALSNTQAAKDVISALRNTGDDAGADMLQTQFRNAYMEKIGISADGTFNGINSKHTPEMVDALWNNPLAAKRINSQIAELNDVLAKVKVDKVNLSAEEADALLDMIPLNERKALLKQIEKKAILQQREDKLFDNEIIKLAKNGQFDAIEGSVLADTALNRATPADLRVIMSNLTPSGKKKLGADMFSKLGVDFAGGVDEELLSGASAGMKTLSWKKVNDSLKGYSRADGRNAPQWLKNMDEVVGKDVMDEFIAVAKLGQANSPLTRVEAESLGIHTLWSPQGQKWYLSNPFGYLNNKTLAVAYGSNNLRPLLRYMSKNIGDKQYEANFNKMMKGITMTRPGMQALIEQSKDDPQFARDVGLMYAEMQADLNKEIEAQRGQ